VIVFTKNDTKPELVFELRADGDVLDLTDAASIALKLRKPSGEIVTRTLTVTNLTTARVEGSFSAGDLDESSDDPMFAEIVVTWDSGAVQHSEEPIEIWVRDEYEELVT
jgi:hypothetical protein